MTGLNNETIALIQWGIVIGFSLAAAYIDLKTMRISNALTFPLFICGLVWAIINGGLTGLGQAFLSCLLLGVPYVLLFIFAGGGAGDAKLMGAIGTWLGLRESAIVLLCVACVGVIMALIKAIMQRRLRLVLTSVLLSFYTFIITVSGGKKLHIANEQNQSDVQANESEMPYGVAICTCVCVASIIVWRIGVEWLW